MKDKRGESSEGEGEMGDRISDASGRKTQYYVRVVKDRRTAKNGLEFLIGCRDYPDSKYDTWEPITNLPSQGTRLLSSTTSGKNMTRSKRQRYFYQ